MLEKIVRERRASLAPHQANMGPHIMVSEASVGDFGEPGYLYITPRRASTQSMGPVVVPVSNPALSVVHPSYFLYFLVVFSHLHF